MTYYLGNTRYLVFIFNSNYAFIDILLLKQKKDLFIKASEISQIKLYISPKFNNDFPLLSSLLAPRI